jgi:uncharacterized protein (TIGR02217 family)
MSLLIFPPPELTNISWGNERESEFLTTRIAAQSGRSSTAAQRVFPVYRWRLSWNVLREAHPVYGNVVRELVGFYNRVKGPATLFLFKDTEDYAIGPDQVIGVGNGVQKKFRLLRDYGGSIEAVVGAAVRSPVDTLVVKIGPIGGPYSPVGGWTESQDGVITFAVAPTVGQEVAVTSEFYFLVRFDEDTMNVRNFTYRLWQGRDIRIASEPVA